MQISFHDMTWVQQSQSLNFSHFKVKRIFNITHALNAIQLWDATSYSL